MAIESNAQKLQDEKVRLANEALSLLGQWDGKDMPDEVFQQAETLFQASATKGDHATLYQQGSEFKTWRDALDESKKLPTPGLVTSKDPSRELETMQMARKSIPVKTMGGTVNYPYERAAKELAQVTRATAKLVNEVREQMGLEAVDTKAWAEGTDTTGGFITPDIFVAEFVQKKYLASHLRASQSRVITLKSDHNRYPKMTTAGTAAVLVTEGNAVSDGTPTVGETDFTPFMYRTLQKASMETIADAEFTLLTDIVLPDMAQQFAAAENGAFTTGTGSGQPQGIITGATSNGVTAANAASITFDDIIKLFHAVPVQYRSVPTFGFMAKDAVIGVIRKIKDSQQRYIWEPATQVGDPDRILGKALYVNNSMAGADPVVTATKTLLCGDFYYYWIGDRQGLDIQTAKELYLANGQIGYFGFARFDAHVMQAEAFAVLTQA